MTIFNNSNFFFLKVDHIVPPPHNDVLLINSRFIYVNFLNFIQRKKIRSCFISCSDKLRFMFGLCKTRGISQSSVWRCESAPRPPVMRCCPHQAVSCLLLTPYRSTTLWSPPETETLSSSDNSVSLTIAATVRVIGSLVETPIYAISTAFVSLSKAKGWQGSPTPPKHIHSIFSRKAYVT